MDCFSFKSLFSNAPLILPQIGPQPNEALRRFEGEETLPIWNVRFRVDPSELVYSDDQPLGSRPRSLLSLVRNAIDNIRKPVEQWLFTPGISLDAYQRALFEVAQLPEIDDLIADDFDAEFDELFTPTYSYDMLLAIIEEKNPQSPYSFACRDLLLAGSRFDDLMEMFYTQCDGARSVWVRSTATFVMEHLSYAFFQNVQNGLWGDWQRDIPFLFIEGEKFLARLSYIPWLMMYNCDHHNPRSPGYRDLISCNSGCKYDLKDFKHFLAFFYAFYFEFEISSFSPIVDLWSSEVFIDGERFTSQEIDNLFVQYMIDNHSERFFPTLGPQSQRRACDRLVKQVNKMTKIASQKKARKAERQLKHIERRALYKIERASARDEKYLPTIGPLGVSKRILASLPHFSRGVKALFTGEVETAVIERWLLMFTPILCSPTPGGFFSAFLYLLNNLGISIFSAAKEMMHYCTQFIKKFAHSALRCFDYWSDLPEHPTESAGIEQALPSLGEEVGDLISHTSDTRKIEELITSYGLKTPALFASILAGAAATVAAYLVGSQPTNTRFKLDAWDRLISGCSNLSKFKSGAYAYISIMRDFCAWTYTLVEDNIMEGTDSALVRLVKNVSLEDVPSEGLIKEKFFEMYTFITNVVNLPTVITSSEWRRKASYVERVLQEICNTLAKSVVLDRDTLLARDTAQKMLLAVQKINQSAFKNHTEKFARMRPCVFMMYGNPGAGKSCFSIRFASDLMDILYKRNEFEIPADPSQRVISVNFTDKYLTSYKNQYCVLVDDIFQDRENAIEGSSSALQFISWVSNAPYGTTQADLNSKGILFESKMIVASSNVSDPSSNSIQSNDALIRRIDYQIRFVPDSTVAPDPAVGGKQIRFEIYQPREVSPGIWKLCQTKTFRNTKDLMVDAAKFFIAHYRKEKYILESRQSSQEVIDELAARIFNEESEEVVPTGGYVSKVKEYFSPPSYVELLRDFDDYYQVYQYALQNNWTKLEGGVLERGPLYDQLEPEAQEMVNNMIHLQAREYDQMTFPQDLDQLPLVQPSIWKRYHTSLSDKLKALTNTRIGRCLSSLVERCGGGAKMLMGGLGLAGIAIAGVSLYHYFKRSEDVFEDVPSGVRYDSGRPRRVAKRTKAQSAFASAGMFDAREDPSSDAVVDSLINHSSCVRVSFTVEGKTFVQTALRIKNTCILTNEHFFTFMIQAFKEIGKTPKFTVVVPINGTIKHVEETFDLSKMCVFPNKDAAIYKCSRAMPAAREITHLFPPQDYELPESTRCVILRTTPNAFCANVDTSPTGLFATFKAKLAKYEYPDKHGNMRPFVMSDSWLVPIAGKRGESGSLLIAQNRQMREKLLGIQSSVGERSGTFFEPINQDDLRIALDRVQCEEPVCIDCCGTLASLGVDTDYESPSMISKESLVYMGQIPKTKALAPPSQTKLVKSLVYDEATSRMGPSVMRTDDPRLKNPDCTNLLMYNMQGYDVRIGPVDQSVLESATEELAQYLSNVYDVENIPNKILDEVEMINGSPGVYKGVDMTTSPGFPFVKERQRPDLKGKFEWFEEFEDPLSKRKMYSMKEKLRARLEFRESEARQGRRLVDSFGYTCLKDEKRTLEKIEKGKTRVFICMPMDYNLLIRKYFGAFVASQHHKAAQPGIASCVGIDPLHSWRTIYTELTAKNQKWEDFDYANWDQSLHPAFFEAYARVVSEFYGDPVQSENHRIRSVLMHELCYTFLIMNNSLVFKTSGQCSGCAITAEINCTIHELLMLYSYKLFWKRQGEVRNITDFLSNCAIRVYGDDILFATSEVNGFCGAEHRIIAEELGMRITTAQKDLNFRVKDPSECTFLKRSFVFDDRFSAIICPIKKEVIEEIPYWIHKSDDDLNATIVNINCALLEAFLCGKDYFDNLRSTLIRRLEKKIPGYAGRVETYGYYLEQYQSGNFKVLALREDVECISEN